MKSQKTLDSKHFDNTLLEMILAWDKCFPSKPYFKKLNFTMMHMPEFVEEFGIYRRASIESHKSVHSQMAKAKETLKRMASTKYRTLFARKIVNLKHVIVEKKTKVDKKIKGKKRQKYSITKTKKRQYQIQFS